MIYLIGVNHDIQHDGIGSASETTLAAFRDYLAELIISFQIHILAEEFNEDALKMSLVTTSQVQKVAHEYKIRHIFLDPDRYERRELGIPKENEIYENLGIDPTNKTKDEFEIFVTELRKSYAVRENFWYDQIADQINNNILVIIGADHIESFSQLLLEHEIELEVINEFWKN